MSHRGQAVFFRSLATLVRAGVALPRGLDVLARQSDERTMREKATELAGLILKGGTLSSSMRKLGFSTLQVHLVTTGEKTGALPHTLEKLAVHLETQDRLRLRLRSALTYPAFVMATCLGLMVLVPGYLMAGQLQLLQDLHVPLPWLTRMLIALSAALKQPVVWFLLAGLGAGALVALRQRPVQEVLLARCARLKLVRVVATTWFAGTLAIMTRTGVMLTESLPLAAATSGFPPLRAAAGAAVAQLLEGASLADSVAGMDFFPRATVEMIRIGEESGRLAELLEWVANYYEQELEVLLARLTALLEPLAMMVMGIVAAVLMLATMLPLVQALQTL